MRRTTLATTPRRQPNTLVLDEKAGGTERARLERRDGVPTERLRRDVGERLYEQSQNGSFGRVDALLARSVLAAQRYRGRSVSVEHDQSGTDRTAVCRARSPTEPVGTRSGGGAGEVEEGQVDASTGEGSDHPRTVGRAHPGLGDRETGQEAGLGGRLMSH